MKDRLLDPGDFFTGTCIGTGGFDPIVEFRPGSLQLLWSAGDGHDLDGSAPLPECLPEAAMRVAPGVKHRRGLMARIDVDEDGAAGVSCVRRRNSAMRSSNCFVRLSIPVHQIYYR